MSFSDKYYALTDALCYICGKKSRYTIGFMPTCPSCKEKENGNRNSDQTVHSNSSNGANQGDTGTKESSTNTAGSPSPDTCTACQGTGIVSVPASPNGTAKAAIQCGLCFGSGRMWATRTMQSTLTPPPLVGRSVLPQYGYASTSSVTFSIQPASFGIFPYVPSDIFTKPIPKEDPKLQDLIGYRIWRYNKGYLQSYAREEIWIPGMPMVGNGLDDHNQAGVWAFKEKPPAYKKYLESSNFPINSSVPSAIHVCHIVGSVLLWGQIIEHSQGYRAEYAKVREIYDVSFPKPWASERDAALKYLRELYGVQSENT